MKPKTEELLNTLLWASGKLLCPTFRNLTASYEEWAYGNGLLKQEIALQNQRWIERDSSSPDERVYRLTAQGRLHVLGGRDPGERWGRAWDGRWRLVLFDIPVGQNAQRMRLRRYLQEKGFGWLQNSVWITPDPLEEECQLLKGCKTNVESLLLLEARPCAGESDADIAVGAWDFDRINRRYVDYLKVLEQRPKVGLHDQARAQAMLRWASAERQAWLHAVRLDPLLPQKLLPGGYRGQEAWRQRQEHLAAAAKLIHAFHP